jgi:hypothetical protein
MHLDGVSHKVAVRMLAGTERVHAPLTMARPQSPPPVPVKVTDNSEFSLQLWADAGPIEGTPAEAYLHRRLHDLRGDDVLRFHPACHFGDTRVACLLALYRDIATNEPKAMGRTAIDSNGNKIGRMSLGPCKGAAFKIDADTDVEQGLLVGKGLETVLAALRGPRGAQDEFVLAAIAQNLRRLTSLVARPPPAGALCIA